MEVEERFCWMEEKGETRETEERERREERERIKERMEKERNKGGRVESACVCECVLTSHRSQLSTDFIIITPLITGNCPTL